MGFLTDVGTVGTSEGAVGWCTEVVWVFGKGLGGCRSVDEKLVLTDCRMGLEVGETEL